MGAPTVNHRSILAPLTLFVLTLFAGACAAHRTPTVIHVPIQDESAQIAEAHRLALAAQNAKTDAKGIDLYRQSVTTYHDLAPAWNNLGVLLMDQRQYLDAAEAFTTASEVVPMDARPLYNLGLTWEKAGYLRDALRYYARALERNPRYQQALRGAIHAERLLGLASEETLRRLRTAIGQEQDATWRQWLELQRPQVEAEVYSRPMSPHDKPDDKPDDTP